MLFEEEKMGNNRQLPRIGDIRKIAEDYFIRHGRRLTFRQALLYYQKNGEPVSHMPSVLYLAQSSLILAADSEEIAIMASQSHSICGI